MKSATTVGRPGDLTTSGDGLFQELARASAGVAPDHVAIVDGDFYLTYQALLRAAAEFGDELAAAGVQSGDRIGVILGNHKEFLVAAFGMWKHGAVPVPLNPQLRETELATYLQDGGVRAIATTSRGERMIAAVRTKGVALEHIWIYASNSDRWLYQGKPAGHASPSVVAADWPAVSQYSTGSTGRPKRVTRTHRQLIGEAQAVARVLGVSAADRILGAAPLFHSYGLIVSGLLTLLSGGTLHVLDTFLPGNVGQLIERERLSGFPGVPFMLQLLADHKDHRDLSSLRFVLSAGASLPDAIAESFATAYGRRIRRLYGSTETGVITVSAVGDEGDANSVGVPIPRVRVEIVDDMQHLLSIGAAGLVKVTSEFAASCYDGAASGSESHFIGDGFVPGDLGRMAPTGKLTLLGRRRNFINVNGYKVDPVEVETVLLELPEITEAAVLGIGDGAGETIKAVLVTAAPGSEQAVRAHCVRRLAAFKCPQVIEFRSELPRNRLGKVLRKDLLEASTSP